MQLRYFLHTDDKDTLRVKYRELAKKWHPDRNLNNQAEATRRMQEINEELDYCLKYGCAFTSDERTNFDLNGLIVEFLKTTLDQIIAEETSISFRLFFINMRQELDAKPLLGLDFLNIMNNVYRMRGIEPPRKFYMNKYDKKS